MPRRLVAAPAPFGAASGADAVLPAAPAPLPLPATAAAGASRPADVASVTGDRETWSIERARARRRRPLSPRARRWSAGRAGSFALVALLLAAGAVDEPRPEPVVVAALIGAYALAWRIEFETGTGVAVPNVLGLVPMLVLLPPGLVPLAAALGSLLGDAVAEQRGRRMLGALVAGWALVPPALIVALLDPGRSWADAWIYALAVAAGIATDAAGMYLQQRVVNGNRDARLGDVLGMYRVEFPLALLAFCGALESDRFRFAFLVPFAVVVLLRELVRERRRRISQAGELARAYHGTARLLGQVIDADDRYTGVHSRGVVETALAVAAALGLDADEQRRTELAALLHDVGKIRTPKEILHKPGPLTPDEWDVVRRHPAEGAAMLDEVGGYLAGIGELVRHHHERYDGRGYPDGLAGADIPLPARIVCACDAFSAMTTDRPYRRALPVADALAELDRGAGAQFDPAVVAALTAVVRADDLAA